MPRKKNPVAKKTAVDDTQIELTPEQAEAPAHGRKVTIERRIYSEPLDPTEAPQVESPDEFEDYGAPDYGQSEVAGDDLLSFFDESAGDDEHMLRVFQLMRPGKGGLHFKNSGIVFRGEIPYTAGFLREVQENYGGGLFRLQVVGYVDDPITGRRKYKILKSRTLTISAPPIPAMPDQGQQPNGPTFPTPHIPYVYPPALNGDQTPPPTMKENLQEMVAIVSMVDKLRGNHDHSQAPAQVDPELAAMQLIANNPSVMEKVRNGIAKTILGDKVVEETSWADVVKSLITSGQGPEMLRVVIQEFMRPFGGLFTPAQNGQYQQQQAPGPAQLAQAEQFQIQPMPDPQAQPMPAQQPVMPEDHALQLMIFDCRRRTPPSVAAGRLIGYADKLNDEAPQYSIDGYIDVFLTMAPDQAIEFVKTQPGGEDVAKLEHAASWIEQLQNLLRQNFQEGQ